MKKILKSILCLILALVTFSAQTMALTISSANSLTSEEIAIAEFDETEIYDAFTEINELVTILHENDGITYSDLKSSNSGLISNLSSDAAIIHDYDDENYPTPPIFSAFVWGCLLNGLGMIIVGLTTGFDGRQMTKSAWGCLFSSLIWGASWWGYSYY